MPSNTDRLEKEIVLDAPRSRVWRAITDFREFNEWFGVTLTSPFTTGAEVSGQMTVPGYTYVTMRVWVETMEPEHHFAFRWHPYAIERNVDYSSEPTTLVTFLLDDVPGGTRLRVIESGFDALPEPRRLPSFKMNSKGWEAQLENVRKHLGATASSSA